MPADNDDSNTLYLMIGGLLVVALIFGFVVYGRYNNPANIEPAAGTAYSSTAGDQTAPKHDMKHDMEDSTPPPSSNTSPAPAPATTP